MNYDVSIIFPACDEGSLCHSSLQSAFRALYYAAEEGIRGEIVVVLDSASRRTRDYFAQYRGDIKIRQVELGDPGLSCNYGIQEAQGRAVFFLEATGLFSSNWIAGACRYLKENPKEVIVHTEYSLGFGKKPFYWKKQSSISSGFTVEKMVENSCWDIGCGADREIFLRFPFPKTTADNGFFFKEHHLYCDALAAGIEQHVVPGTVYFTKNVPPGSQSELSAEHYKLLSPSPFFDEKIFLRLLSSQNS